MYTHLITYISHDNLNIKKESLTSYFYKCHDINFKGNFLQIEEK
jgi:hypothetical protein